MSAADKLRCMTCNKDYDAGAAGAIHSRLEHFEGWCICQNCVDIYRKRKPAEKKKRRALGRTCSEGSLDNEKR